MAFRSILIGFGLVFAAGQVSAQAFQHRPDFQIVELESGFLPDPEVVQLRAGGARSAASLAPGCVGMVARRANIELRYEAGASPLVLTSDSPADTSLVVQGPDGRWRCDDDGLDGRNARIVISSPQSGTYRIWLGAFGQPRPIGEVRISEMLGGGRYGPEASDDGRDAPDHAAPAAYGSRRLRAGFTPDPFRRAVTAGGTVDASRVENGCSGFTAIAPSFELTYDAAGMPLAIRANADRDVTLMVNTPDGEWLCDDDGGEGTNAEIRLNAPRSGVYDIWVGVFGGGTAPAVLQITETP
jgi:hypothetical protein